MFSLKRVTSFGQPLITELSEDEVRTDGCRLEEDKRKLVSFCLQFFEWFIQFLKLPNTFLHWI